MARQDAPTARLRSAHGPARPRQSAGQHHTPLSLSFLAWTKLRGGQCQSPLPGRRVPSAPLALEGFLAGGGFEHRPNPHPNPPAATTGGRCRAEEMEEAATKTPWQTRRPGKHQPCTPPDSGLSGGLMWVQTRPFPPG